MYAICTRYSYQLSRTNSDRRLRPGPSRELPGDPDEIKVTVLNVFEEFDVYDDMGGTSSDQLYDEVDLPAGVPIAVDFLEEREIRTDVRREHGDPKETIVDVAHELDVDMIALGGRKQTPVGKALFGSVARQAVLLNAARPVFVTISE